ncbi:MAG: ResB-like [Mycobacterium sp.]|nr:ResB-like [Mycobacterium sp.]
MVSPAVTSQEARLEAPELLSTAPQEPGERPSPGGRRRPFAPLVRAWRQLTSMRTALLLLFLLALAAVPGSLLPQRSVDPTLVTIFIAKHPKLGPFLDRLSGFDVFAAPWFAAIYALLFISLIGCLIPRMRMHAKALLRRPPKAPAHPARLSTGTSFETSAPIADVIAAGTKVLRSRRYRVSSDDASVAAEKGYLRETGNLAFHVSLVVLLAGIAVGSMFGYTGKVVVTDGGGFTNTLVQYDNFNRGALVKPDQLDPFSFHLNEFTASYQADGTPKTYAADVTLRKTLGGPTSHHVVRVNDPLKIGEAKVYLINHGYSPHVTLKDSKGHVVFDDYVPCVASDIHNLTSSCVFKIPDTGLPTVGPLKKVQQIGVRAVLAPTFEADNFNGSIFPALLNPRLAGVQVYVGDLGIDAGTPQNVYSLDTTRMTLDKNIKGPDGSSTPILDPRNPKADSVTGLPDGMVLTVDNVKNYAVFSIKYDPGKGLVLWAAIAMLAGLIGSLLVRRRRMWIRARPASSPGHTVVEIGGLARTGSLSAEFEDLVRRVKSRLPEQG